jgi:uncharacterized cupin superfamily protein
MLIRGPLCTRLTLAPARRRIEPRNRGEGRDARERRHVFGRSHPNGSAGEAAADGREDRELRPPLPDRALTVPEIPLRETNFGLVADGDGWFVINARESRWRDAGHFGRFCNFEGKRRFSQLGINLNVLEPGQPIGMYHREGKQEDFLVLSGECLLLVEGEERKLRAWDFVHCPPETNHMIVGAGSGPAVVLAVGARGGRKGLIYPVEPLAVEHRAGVEQETTKPAEAYAAFPSWPRCRYQEGWLPD